MTGLADSAFFALAVRHTETYVTKPTDGADFGRATPLSTASHPDDTSIKDNSLSLAFGWTLRTPSLDIYMYRCEWSGSCRVVATYNIGAKWGCRAPGE